MIKVVLSFDDGRQDTFLNSFRIIRNHNLTASIHITTGFIDNTFFTDEFGYGMKPILIEDIKTMSKYGIDISSHGDRHIMEKTDFEKSKEKINLWTGINERVGFSVPNSSASKNEIIKFLEELKFDPLYIRVGRNEKCRSFLNKIKYVLYKFFKAQLFFNSFNKYNLISELDKFNIISCVVKKHTSAKHIVNFIKKYADRDSTFVLMLHSVVEKPKNEWEWQIDQFNNLCEELRILKSAGTINVVTLKDLALEAKNE